LLCRGCGFGKHVTLLAKLSHPRGAAGGKFRVILLMPGGLVAAEKGEKVATAQFGAGRLDEKSGATARADGRVDFGDEIVG